MTYRYGEKSQGKLDTCDDELQLVAELGLSMSPYDITIIHGWRGEALQNALVDSGVSRTRWPDSDHNFMDAMGNPLSMAFDFAPWVEGAIPWKDTHIFAVLAGCFFAAADQLEVRIKWGGDWDTDGSTKDQTLMDWGHIAKVN